MRSLHIVQGGIENGDKRIIERLAATGGRTARWVVPKRSLPGDEVVIHVGGYGFFATAIVDGQTKLRKDWRNRYGAPLADVKLIQPPVSVVVVRRYCPKLSWARYPRSITTPSRSVANTVRSLIRKRRKTGIPELNDDVLNHGNLDELRKIATMRPLRSAPERTRKVVYRYRSMAIKSFVLRRAEGNCEYCGTAAPFCRPDGTAYLEPHHTTRVADEGPDHPAHVIALCPNCHRRAHFADDAEAFNKKLMKRLRKIEPNR